MAILPMPSANRDAGKPLCLGLPDVHWIDELPSLALLSGTAGSGMEIKSRLAGNTGAEVPHQIVPPTTSGEQVLRQSSIAAHLLHSNSAGWLSSCTTS